MKLIVKKLNKITTSEKLEEFLREVDIKPTACEVVLDKNTGESTGEGLLEVSNEEIKMLLSSICVIDANQVKFEVLKKV